VAAAAHLNARWHVQSLIAEGHLEARCLMHVSLQHTPPVNSRQLHLQDCRQTHAMRLSMTPCLIMLQTDCVCWWDLGCLLTPRNMRNTMC
jgi:hypothetical protein